MTLSKKALYWESNPAWYRINPDTGDYEMTEAAPPEAVENFNAWLKAMGFKPKRKSKSTN